jgi:hypothetical protein
MKSIILISLVLITSFTSCTIQKRLYRNGYSVHWNSIDKSTKSDIVNNDFETPISELKEENSDFVSTSNEIIIQEKEVVNLKNENLALKKVQSSKTIDPTKCDLILLKNGEEISVKVLEIKDTEVKYKRFDNFGEPTITINKSSISSITYSNGTNEVIKAENSSNTNFNSIENSSGRKKVGLAIASLVVGIIGFPFGGGILALIFGVIQLSRIRMQPNVYGGKGMAIAGLIIGIIGVIFLFLLLFLSLLF